MIHPDTIASFIQHFAFDNILRSDITHNNPPKNPYAVAILTKQLCQFPSKLPVPNRKFSNKL